MSARSKETPSVASTRVLRTHRINEVESFRLQDRIKTIHCESKHNYSQISDEIAGVRKNLTKIKDVANSHGVSVERRKLLHEQGLRILPPCRGNDSTWKVKSADGKEFTLDSSEFFDSESLRKKISITANVSPAWTAISPEEDIKSVEKEEKQSAQKCIRYRVITPPHRPGSRQNFQVVDTNDSEEEEELAAPRGHRSRAQTAFIRRQSTRFMLRPRSETCPAGIRSARSESPRKSSFVKSQRKTSSLSLRSTDESGTPKECTVLHEEERDLAGRDPLRRSSTNDSNHEISMKVPQSYSLDKRRVSNDSDRTLAQHTGNVRVYNRNYKDATSPCAGKLAWANTAAPGHCSAKQGNSTSEARNSSGTNARKVSFISTRDHVVKSAPQMRTDRERKKSGSSSCNSESDRRGSIPTVGRNSRTDQPRDKPTQGSESHDHAASLPRRKKALNKGFTTMQMTIGNKQIKVHIPKFTTDLTDEMAERAWVKTAGRPRLPSVTSI